MIQVVINKDQKTVSPPNPLAVNEMQATPPIYPIRETVCKSGIVLDAGILSYHSGDKREAELHEDNSVTLYGPYK